MVILHISLAHPPEAAHANTAAMILFLFIE